MTHDKMQVGTSIKVDWPMTNDSVESFGARIIQTRSNRKRKRYLLAWDDGDAPLWSRLANGAVLNRKKATFTLARPQALPQHHGTVCSLTLSQVIRNVGLSNNEVSRVHPWDCEEV